MTRISVAEAVALFGREAIRKGSCAPCANGNHRKCERNARPPKGCICDRHASKYRAEPRIIDGVRFASKREAARYGELRMELKAKRIVNLEMQKRYALIVNEIPICFYVADFVYERDGARIVEDAKGMRTREYRLKKKLMLACHGIAIVEV